MKKIKLISVGLLCFLLILGACSFPQIQAPVESNRTIAASDFDNLIEELKGYYDSGLSADRKAEIRTVQENILKYLIEATGETDAYKIKIYKEANAYFNKVYPLILNNIRNEKSGVANFSVIKKAPLWTLKEELRFLNSEASSLPNPAFKIDLAKGLSMLSSLHEKNPLDKKKKELVDEKYNQAVQKVMGKDFDLHPSMTELEALAEPKLTEEQRILKVVNLVESKISVHEKKIRNIGSEIAKSSQVDMKNGQIRIVVKFMDYYFNKVPADVVKTIMSELVTGREKLVEEDVMKIIFQNTGPGLGKVLQQIGKEKGVGEQFSKLMEILESSGKEVPMHLVTEVVKSDVGGFEVKAIEAKVGTGTIAQVNKAKIWANDKEVDVALRFLKPGVAARCKEDIKILRQFVPDNEALFAQEGVQDIAIMDTLINSVEKFLNEEVDLSIAVERQKKAFEIYNRSIKISNNSTFDLLEMQVPEVYLPPNGKSNLHIQEFAAGGVKFNGLTDNGTKKIVAQEMVRMWFEEALFKSGFLNADLHQGNFRIVLVEENKKIKILLYDFGLSSTLTAEEQRAFLLVGAGAYLKSPGTLADGLMISMKPTDIGLRAKLMADIKKEMVSDPNKKPEDWVVWCVQKNYFVSENLGAFARGSLLLKQLPETMGEQTMFKDTIVKAAVSNLWRSVADRDYDYPLTKMDMIKIAGIQIKNSCVNLFQSFFKK